MQLHFSEQLHESSAVQHAKIQDAIICLLLSVRGVWDGWQWHLCIGTKVNTNHSATHKHKNKL